MADSPLEGDYGQAEEGTTRELDPAEEQPQKAAKDSSWYKETAAQEGSKDSVAPAEAQQAEPTTPKGKSKGAKAMKLKWMCRGCVHLISDKPRYKEEDPEDCKHCPPGTKYFGPLSQRACWQEFKRTKRQGQSEGWEDHGKRPGKPWSNEPGAGQGWKGKDWGEGAKEVRPQHQPRLPAGQRSQTGSSPSPRTLPQEEETEEKKNEEVTVPWRKQPAPPAKASREQERQGQKERKGKDHMERSAREKSRSRDRRRRDKSRSRRRQRNAKEEIKKEKEIRDAKERIRENQSSKDKALLRVESRKAAMTSAASVTSVSVDDQERTLAISFLTTLLRLQEEDQKFVKELEREIHTDSRWVAKRQ